MPTPNDGLREKILDIIVKVGYSYEGSKGSKPLLTDDRAVDAILSLFTEHTKELEKEFRVLRDKLLAVRSGDEIRESVIRFARNMECKLMLNDVEKGKEGWRGTEDYLFIAAIRKRLKRLNKNPTIADCVDIGNYAMMIADNLEDSK